MTHCDKCDLVGLEKKKKGKISVGKPMEKTCQNPYPCLASRGLVRVRNSLPDPYPSVVIDTGPGISGGYTDRGTPDTDTDTDFCIRRHTHTPTRHTHTHDGGYVS